MGRSASGDETAPELLRACLQSVPEDGERGEKAGPLKP